MKRAKVTLPHLLVHLLVHVSSSVSSSVSSPIDSSIDLVKKMMKRLSKSFSGESIELYYKGRVSKDAEERIFKLKKALRTVFADYKQAVKCRKTLKGKGYGKLVKYCLEGYQIDAAVDAMVEFFLLNAGRPLNENINELREEYKEEKLLLYVEKQTERALAHKRSSVSISVAIPNEIIIQKLIDNFGDLLWNNWLGRCDDTTMHSRNAINILKKAMPKGVEPVVVRYIQDCAKEWFNEYLMRAKERLVTKHRKGREVRRDESIRLQQKRHSLRHKVNEEAYQSLQSEIKVFCAESKRIYSEGKELIKEHRMLDRGNMTNILANMSNDVQRLFVLYISGVDISSAEKANEHIEYAQWHYREKSKSLDNKKGKAIAGGKVHEKKMQVREEDDDIDLSNVCDGGDYLFPCHIESPIADNQDFVQLVQYTPVDDTIYFRDEEEKSDVKNEDYSELCQNNADGSDAFVTNHSVIIPTCLSSIKRPTERKYGVIGSCVEFGEERRDEFGCFDLEDGPLTFI